MIRWTIKRNGAARRMALYGDDLLYGRHPKTKFPFPEWYAPNGTHPIAKKTP